MLVIAVVDRDEGMLSDTAERIDGILEDQPHTFARFPDGESLAEKVDSRAFLPDIVVLTLDASMNGIETAGRINRLAPDCEILFLAENADHMTDVYTVAHACFMLKGRMDEYLRDAVLRAVETLRKKQEDARRRSVFVKVHTKMIRFLSDEIVSLERVGRSTVIHTRDGEFVTVEHPLSLVSRITGSHFLRCHQSYWVNTIHIREGSVKELVMEDGNRIPVSRSYRVEMRKLGSGFLQD